MSHLRNCAFFLHTKSAIILCICHENTLKDIKKQLDKDDYNIYKRLLLWSVTNFGIFLESTFSFLPI